MTPANSSALMHSVLPKMTAAIWKRSKKSFHGGPAGVRALAAGLHEDSDTIEYVYEPYLLRLGFIERSPRGRILTPKGREYLSGEELDSLF